MSIKMLTYYYC